MAARQTASVLAALLSTQGPKGERRSAAHSTAFNSWAMHNPGAPRDFCPLPDKALDQSRSVAWSWLVVALSVVDMAHACGGTELAK